MDIRYCARLFQKWGLPQAPVIEQDRIVGIVSYTDIGVFSMNGGGPVNRNPLNPLCRREVPRQRRGDFSRSAPQLA
jgi:predicted transcriptional regulator